MAPYGKSLFTAHVPSGRQALRGLASRGFAAGVPRAAGIPLKAYTLRVQSTELQGILVVSIVRNPNDDVGRL